MGLDTTHNAWHGAYSAFSRWRKTLAELAGYATANVKFDNGTEREIVMIDWGHITASNLAGEWESTPSDPLMVLIAHSDCDGMIYPAQAAPLADRLEELLPKLLEGDASGWKETTELFIHGLRKAVEANEPVEFH